MIVAVLNQKGGVGKATLALHLGAGLVRHGARVLVADADPQGSARDWAAARQIPPLFPVIGLDRPTLHRDLPDLAAGYAHVVIDGVVYLGPADKYSSLLTSRPKVSISR